MSTATIHIPRDHVGAVRDSLLARRQELAGDVDANTARFLPEIDAVLDQLDTDTLDVDRPVTGSRSILWNAAYDALCVAAERLASDCNEVWRGSVDPAELHVQLAAIGERLTLLGSFGPPPDDV